MRNLETLNIGEGAAMNAIFDACRANEKREARNGVTFRLLVTGEHEAALRDASGTVVALAIVDQLDC